MEFAEFQKRIYQHFGLNLAGYKEKQLKRRITSLMQSQGINDFKQYFDLLVRDEEQLARFLDKVTINVSEFFRNPEIFKVLETKILPELLKTKSRLKIWSAACSNGAEPYSVAIILEELTPGVKHQIEATDIDRKILEAAKRGFYEERFLKNVSPERLKRFFRPEGNGYLISEDIKRRVQFRYHDLLVDEYGRNYDLIVCRNVTIYFTMEAQDLLYRKFREALNPGGILFIGATENMLYYRELGYEKVMPWFYRRSVD
ncbi:MAG TPA: protein-glutamate O-methyltransferase CheR [Clostridia bacterium]|nr:protein-glutamate O-methyltransferase CheR [Clostridia bacterium]